MTLASAVNENMHRRSYLILAIACGLMLGFAFPPSPFYSLAYLGLVPLLFLITRIDTLGSLLRYTYFSMVLFHVVTLYWVGGFTHLRDQYLVITGFGLMLIHPLFYWIPVVGTWVILKRWGEQAALFIFPFLWVGFEYAHGLGEFSFPWLTLGNSQAYDLNRIQILEYTSVYGLSLLLAVFNVLSFILLRNLSERMWRILSGKSLSVIMSLLCLYLIPLVYGVMRQESFDALDGDTTVAVGVVQPDIDPFEKWGEGYASEWESYARQLTILYEHTRTLSRDSLDMVVWPETAIPFYILLPQNAEFYNQLKHEIDFAATPVFTGLPDGVYMDSSNATATAKWLPHAQRFFEGYNAATLFVPYERHGPVYHKVVLVPFAERVPYAETFSFLIDVVRWSVGLGSWGKGTDRIVYTLPTRNGPTVRFSGMICYELVFPHYVRQFVRNGAQFLVVISNDSWWGNTSGARQLAAYTSLRAVETRRWIVRCANGGISGIIDPAGRVYNETDMYTRVAFSGALKALDEETVYVHYGDIAGAGSAAIGLIGLAGAIIRKRRGREPDAS
ncbi:MAG: apolipoprotein N-acyltransferase [Ignavibacteriales bacterium]|nr:apolipoprotein N-acyltransferase [Ignavibacteriales bacterium]